MGPDKTALGSSSFFGSILGFSLILFPSLSLFALFLCIRGSSFVLLIKIANLKGRRCGKGSVFTVIGEMCALEKGDIIVSYVVIMKINAINLRNVEHENKIANAQKKTFLGVISRLLLNLSEG